MRLRVMSVRGGMLVVAVAALASFSPRAYQHWFDCHALTGFCEAPEAYALQQFESYAHHYQPPGPMPSPEHSAECLRSRQAFDASLAGMLHEVHRTDALKYGRIKRALRRSAWRPWEPLPKMDW